VWEKYSKYTPKLIKRIKISKRCVKGIEKQENAIYNILFKSVQLV